MNIYIYIWKSCNTIIIGDDHLLVMFCTCKLEKRWCLSNECPRFAFTKSGLVFDLKPIITTMYRLDSGSWNKRDIGLKGWSSLPFSNMGFSSTIGLTLIGFGSCIFSQYGWKYLKIYEYKVNQKWICRKNKAKLCASLDVWMNSQLQGLSAFYRQAQYASHACMHICIVLLYSLLLLLVLLLNEWTIKILIKNQREEEVEITLDSIYIRKSFHCPCYNIRENHLYFLRCVCHVGLD